MTKGIGRSGHRVVGRLSFAVRRPLRANREQRRTRGYILISLMLFLSLLAIAALAVLPNLAFQVKRDREEEMIHRGVQYSRGVRRYFKKMGRYPTRVEDLENTNNIRFLRKRYTDPMNVVEGKEQEFKIMHMADMAGMGLSGTGGLAAPGQAGIPGGLGAASQAQQQAAMQMVAQAAAAQQAQQSATDINSENGPGAANATNSPNPPSTTASPSSPSPLSSSANGPGGQVFGGGPMLGVASTNKKKTIREFCKKNHYNDWKFIYDPSFDLGPSPSAPWCPEAAVQGLGAGFNRNGIGPAQPNPNQPGQPNPAGPGTPGQQIPNPGSQIPPDQ